MEVAEQLEASSMSSTLTQTKIRRRARKNKQITLRKARLLRYLKSTSGDVADDTEPADVYLLQSTLRSSQSRRNVRSWLPFSSHWAIEIRGEVFELNRTDHWPKTRLTSVIHSNSLTVFFGFWIELALLPIGGAGARIDVSKSEDYIR